MLMDIPLTLPADKSLTKLQLNIDGAKYSDTMQRVVVFMLTHPTDVGEDTLVTGYELVSGHNVGGFRAMLDKLDAIALEFIRGESEEEQPVVESIDVAGDVVGASARIKITVRSLNGDVEESELSING